jgi:hypothetical protein
MKQEAKTLIDSIKPMLEVCLQYADRLELDQIHIATGRAKELLKQVKDLEKQLPVKNNKSMFEYLDSKIAV